MGMVRVDDGAVGINASFIAADLGLDPRQVLESMRTGQLTALCERGVAEDAGRHRLTFLRKDRQLRLIIDEHGRVLERKSSRVEGRRPPPAHGAGGAASSK
jgi:Family of unknown function (DUF6522)